MSATGGQACRSWRELVLLCGLVTMAALDRRAEAVVRPWRCGHMGQCSPPPTRVRHPSSEWGLSGGPGASLRPHSHEEYPIR